MLCALHVKEYLDQRRRRRRHMHYIKCISQLFMLAFYLTVRRRSVVEMNNAHIFKRMNAYVFASECIHQIDRLKSPTETKVAARQTVKLQHAVKIHSRLAFAAYVA